MSNRSSSDEEILARLVREAGEPRVVPDPLYAETLQARILDRVGPEESIISRAEAVQRVGGLPAITVERAQTMKRITSLAVAATILVSFGMLVFWAIGGGSANIAFAEVAKALDNLRSATYDFTSEFKNPVDDKTTTTKSKGYFLAPSLERNEMSMSIGSDQDATRSIMILDCLAAKGITLLPDEKKAMIINISTTEKSAGGTANMFETVRQLVRQGGTDSGKKFESLGEKEIDGTPAIGFRTHNNMADVTLWADPQTARLVRVEFDRLAGGGRGVMSNFRYDIELEPSLFSLEPPAGYTVQTQSVAMPVEEDFINVLRLVAEHNDGIFPDSIGTNEKTIMLAMQAEVKSESEKLLKTPKAQELMKKLKAQFGEDKAGYMKAWMKEWMEMSGPITQEHIQKYMQGVMFYATLQPENDSHYAGKDVKLGTPDRPIFWYKPIGIDKYRVIYADLSIKDMALEDLKKLPKAQAG
jgi:outer membrane lipoprotein-sorting protein